MKKNRSKVINKAVAALLIVVQICSFTNFPVLAAELKELTSARHGIVLDDESADPESTEAPAVESEPVSEEPGETADDPAEDLPGTDEPAPEEPVPDEPVTGDPDGEDPDPAEPTEPGDGTTEPDVTPEPEEEPSVEPGPAMPAAHFTGVANRVTAEVDAPEGAFPEGTTMKVVAVRDKEVIANVAEAADSDVSDVVALDISFWYNGVEIEPQQPINVKLTSAKIEQADEAKIVHVDDSGEAKVIEEAEISGKTAEFSSDMFSVYAVIVTLVPRLTVVFKNGDTELASPIIKEADTAEEVEEIIYDPGVGAIGAGQVFNGWTTDEEYTNESTFLTIDQVRTAAMSTVAGLDSDATVTYYAGIFNQYTVTYVDGGGITVGAEVAETPSRLTEAPYTVNQGYNTDDTHNFEGWIAIDGSSNIKDYPAGAQTETVGEETVYYYTNGTEITLTGNVKFSVEAPEGHWLVFDENGKGATYNAPRFIKSGETTSDADLLEMVRNGYTFGGWYKDAACTAGNEFTFGGTISETTTIYAKWTAIESAPYTVIIWKQNVAGDDYDFVEAVRASGNVNTTPTAVNTSNGRVTGATYNGETGFHYKNTDQASKTITPEGNTVVNVYYDRNEYTLKFQIYDYVYTPTTSTSNNQTQYGLVDGQYVALTRHGRNNNYYWTYGDTYWSEGTRYEGTRYTRSWDRSWQTIKEVTALYGQNIRNYFPIVGTNGVTYTGASWQPNGSSIFNNNNYILLNLSHQL